MKSSEKLGIFSLSQNNLDELLWAHYADSHNGFCIEYKLNDLLNSNSSDNLYHFPVVYRSNPPSISTLEFMRLIETKAQHKLFQKMAGYKSKRWSYEKEIRIVTDFYGKYSHNHQAVSKIFFGLKMNTDKKNLIMEKLQGRGIEYFQIIRADKSYNLIANQINDKYFKEPN